MSQKRLTGSDAGKREKGNGEQTEPSARGAAEAEQVEEKKRGRPAGKRTNPEYRQLTIFVRNDTLDRVKIALIKNKGEVSELAEQLFSEWLDQHNA